MSAPTPSPTLDLDEHLCFTLYAASRAVTARYRPLLEPLGLTYPQYLVMLVLWERGSVTMGDLGRQLQLDSGTLSPVLKRLTADGLLTRRRRVEDERTVEVTITPVGRALRRRAAKVPVRMCESMGLAASEFAELQTLLRRLTAAVGGAPIPV